MSRDLRRRISEAQDDLDRLSGSNAGSVTLLIQTATMTSYPTTAQVFYSVVEVTPNGTEVENGSPVFTVGTVKFAALNIGSGVPPPGTMALADCVNGRYIFNYS